MPPGPTLDRGGETRRARATWWTMTLINAGPGRSRRASAHPPLSRAASPAPLARENAGGKRLTFSRSSYIMAAIDRVTHHCVILDMMAVDSYRAHQAHHQHLTQLEEATIGTNT